MMKKLSVIIILFMMAFFVTAITSIAGSQTDPARMQKHVDEVKITHPAEYQAMMDAAGGVIEDCTSCHKDMKTKKSLADYKYPRYPKR